MNKVYLKKKHEGIYKGTSVTERDFDTLINESSYVYDPDGKLFLVVIKNGISKEAIKGAWLAIKDYDLTTRNRSTSSGVKAKKHVRKDGTLSNTGATDELIHSGIAGYFDRYPRMPYCRACAFNMNHPKEWEMLKPQIKEVSQLFKEHWRERYDYQFQYAQRTNKDFIIEDSIFTTVTINKNYQTFVHQDPKNLPGSVSCLSVIREGKFHGGHLVLPEWRVAMQLDSGDVAIFNNCEEWHANTPIVKISKNAARYSFVYYFREGMIHCGSAEEEAEIAKRRKLGDPLNEKN